MEEGKVVIVLSNFHKICRICLEEGVELQSVYNVLMHSEEKTEEITLLNILKRHCDLEISPTDEKPQQVCKLCIKLLTESYTFFHKCVQTNILLDSILSESKPLHLDAKIESDPNQSEWDLTQDQQPTFSEPEEPTFGGDCYDDCNWELLKVEKVEIQVAAEDEHHSLEDEVEMKSQPAGRRKRGSPEHIQKPITKRVRLKKNQTSGSKIETDDSDAIENQNKELVCRFCSKVLPDVNTSIDHYDELHAAELEVGECILCIRPKQYKRRNNLIYHMGLHSKDSMKCIPCRKYFRTKDLFADHLTKCFRVDVKTRKVQREGLRNGGLKSQQVNTQLSQKVLKLTQYDGAFTCQLCNENLGEIESVISHYETSHSNNLTCLICLRQFTRQVPLFHLGLHSKKSHVCRPCRLFFHTKDELEDHNVKYDHDKSLSCKICGKKFTRNYKRNIHMLGHRKEKNYFCNKCGKAFTYRTSLVRHLKIHFGKRFLCSLCGNVYTTKFMMQRHSQLMHTDVDEDGNPLRNSDQLDIHMGYKYMCDVCGKRFQFESGLKAHHLTHENARFRCDKCGKTAISQAQLKIHYRVHTGERPFTCDICDKSFKRTAQLKVHMFQHTGNMPFKCKWCEKSFPYKQAMKIHMRTHTGEKPFQCKHCGKTAISQAQLKIHYRVHTGERPFTCEICNKSFKQTAHLKVHMFQHTGNKPFKCKLCEKSFPFPQVLEVHMRTHTGEKPFQCKHCGNSYHDRTTLQKHHKKKHPEIPIEKATRND